jgi:hypothetical protein
MSRSSRQAVFEPVQGSQGNGNLKLQLRGAEKFCSDGRRSARNSQDKARLNLETCLGLFSSIELATLRGPKIRIWLVRQGRIRRGYSGIWCEKALLLARNQLKNGLKFAGFVYRSVNGLKS